MIFIDPSSSPKSRIWETKNLSTDADSSTNTNKNPPIPNSPKGPAFGGGGDKYTRKQTHQYYESMGPEGRRFEKTE